MSKTPLSFLDLKSLPLQKIHAVFSRARQFGLRQNYSPSGFQGKSLALLFFEASTRTRISFEIAGHRLGLATTLLDAGMKSSLEKGESIEDSILNVCAMGPSAVVIRCGDELNLQQLALKSEAPLLNAGWGLRGHPSQALLDLFTIQEQFGHLEKIKIVYIGDIRHSRVVASHLEVAEPLGLQLKFCTPDYFLPDNNSRTNFKSLKEAAAWADVIYCLRSQFERHGANSLLTQEDEVRKYREDYTLRKEHLEVLNSKSIFMHPGPVHIGLDIQNEVLADPRNQILAQVKNGVLIRQALLDLSLRGELHDH